MPFPVVVLFPNSAQYIFSAPFHSSRLPFKRIPYFGYGLHVTILFFVFHSQAASLSHSIPIAEEQQDSKEMGQCVLFGKRTIKNSTRTSDSTSIPKISPAIAIYFDKWKIVPISANEITFMELLYCTSPSSGWGASALTPAQWQWHWNDCFPPAPRVPGVHIILPSWQNLLEGEDSCS